MPTPSDDALNAAWNDAIADRNEPSANHDGIDPADAQLLRTMHGAANRTQPDPVFRDGLWAELTQRVATGAGAPVTPEKPAVWTGANAMRPVMRTAPSGHRWSSPLATIAAALLIALVGYGALSLSGANPSGINLDLNDVPNASAQGQAQEIAANPVVGTWVIWANAFSDTNTVSILLNFEPDGILTSDISGLMRGAGQWTTSTNGRISFQYTAFQPYDQIADRYQIGDPVIPILFQVGGSFRLTADGRTWEDEQWSGTTIGIDASGSPVKRVEDIDAPGSTAAGTVRHAPERLEDLIARSPDMTTEQQEFLDAGGNQPSVSPMPTLDPGQQATVVVQATMTAVTGQQGRADAGDASPPPAAQVTVTPLPTQTSVPLPSPSPAP